jgi:predicted metal-dependent phosphoesterase TrpH
MDNPVADFHIHSGYSHDALMSPESIVRRAKKTGLSAVAITDHNTIQGGIRAQKPGKRAGVEIIVGAEVKTDSGDITGLCLNQEIKSAEWSSVIDEIRSQGGIVVLPHPYRDHEIPEEIARAVDFVEVWNSRCTPKENDNAALLADRLGKKAIFGSDAHCPAEIGLVKVKVDPVSFEMKEVITTSYTSPWNVRKSRIISHAKRHEFRTLLEKGAGFLWKKIA